MKYLLALTSLWILSVAANATTLKINGSTTVNLPAAEAAEILRAEKKLDIQVDTNGGSSGGISALGDGLVQIGMSSKPLASEGACDRGAKSIASPDHEADAARQSRVAHRSKSTPRKTKTA